MSEFCCHANIYTNLKNDRKTYSRVILFVYFDGLVSLCGDQSALRVVEHTGKDARLAVQGSGLHRCMYPLEVVARPPIPHVDGSVVGYKGGQTW